MAPTTGWSRGLPPMEPKNGAPPKLKRPPSAATSQYPPTGSAVMATTGPLRGVPPMEPEKWASPKVKTPPSAATSQ